MNELNKEIKIDYLSLTFPIIVLPKQNELEMINNIKNMFKDFLNLKPYEVKEDPYSKNNYKYQYTLGNFITLRCQGPMNELGYKTCHLELKGEGCREFERLRSDISWYDFLIFLDGLNPKYKRIDIAIDDFEGNEITLDWLLNKLKKGHYTSVFKGPYTPIGSIETGLSITFGTHKSPIQLCIYDKLIEQAKRGKPVLENYWVRYEMRFKDTKAETVINSLLEEYTNKDDTFYGLNIQKFAYEALYKILDIKVDNEAKKDHQKQYNTDESWLKFLNNVSKAELAPLKVRESNYDKSYNYTSPKMVELMLVAFLRSKGNENLFLYSMYSEILKHTENLSKQKIKRLSKYSSDLGLPLLDENEIDRIRKMIIEKQAEMEMPF